MASIFAKPSVHQQRQSSNSNSASASSVATAPRVIPSSSKNAVHPAFRSHSPVGGSANLTSLSANTLSPDVKRRTSAVYNRPSSVGGITEGIGTLNRWSQSTASSKSSATAHNKRNSFARRLSGSFGSLGGLALSQSPPKARTLLQKSNASPGSSPQRSSPTAHQNHPSARLPPVLTLPSLSQAVEFADTPSTCPTVTPATAELFTPSTALSRTPDYFGDTWSNRSSPRQGKGVPRTPAMPPSNSSLPTASKSVSHGTRNVVTVPPSSSFNGSPNHSRDYPHERHKDRVRQPRSGQPPTRDEVVKDGGGTEGDSSTSSVPSHRENGRRRKMPSQKAMLSKALQKANHAVLLDRAENYEGAMDAYGDACDLLLQVMLRSSGDEDRKKLEDIRNTYKSRIKDLQNTQIFRPGMDSKALPDRPMSLDSKEQDPFSQITDDDDEAAIIETATVTRVPYDYSQAVDRGPSRTLTREQLPPRRQSLMPFAFSEENVANSSQRVDGQIPHQTPQPSYSPQDSVPQTTSGLAPPMEKEYMPPPLSPRRPLSPAVPTQVPPTDDRPSQKQSVPTQAQHVRHETAETTSWLDTIDESGGSSACSVHSRSSSFGLRRKRMRALSGATEAEFDAALDAAVEAAYDDGFEPMVDDAEEQVTSPVSQVVSDAYVSDARRNVDLAKQRVREAEREAVIALAKDQAKKRLQETTVSRERSNSIDANYTEDESEEEERILEEMTRDFILDDLEYDIQSKSALPRQSDSSGFSGRTMGSSVGSNPTTAGTSLSTVAEVSTMPWPPSQHHFKPTPPPAHPPPMGALPHPPRSDGSSLPVAFPRSNPPRPPSLVIVTGPGVRERRLSGQKIKQLKIDTNTRLPPGMTAPKTQPSLVLPPIISAQAMTEPPKSASIVRESQQLLPSSTFKPPALQSGGSRPLFIPLPDSSTSDFTSGISPATPSSNKDAPSHGDDRIPSIPKSPVQHVKPVTDSETLRKNLSSTSLRIGKPSSTTPNLSEDSPNTPLTKSFSATSQHRNGTIPMIPDLPTPTGAAFIANSLPTDGMHYFDDINCSTSPGSPNSSIANAPLPLEPCPESSVLRPFWLLRTFYHTLAHPRGGYLSNRLFVPRDIWRVKNVKIKAMEEKVSNCDLLTAALLKVSMVDMLDADAVFKEMQSFEMILDQVQVVLAKKLGGEVGVQGTAGLFKGSSVTEDVGSTAETLGAKSTNVSSKSYLSSWRKLRSKTSVGPGLPPPGTVYSGKDGSRDNLTMRSLPMTSLANPRFAKRDASKVQGIGPNAHYMSALARLCAAVQVLDQIARQVEDPGLKRSSPTYVGLELSTQRAAQFFGFYVCRFVLNDMGMMMDKYLKRGSEWALA